MSINDSERQQTAAELTSLRSALPMADEVLADRLGYSAEDLRAVLAMRSGIDPREVWRVGDFLVAVAEARGVAIPHFSVLKDSKRNAARGWFGSWDVPEAGGI